MSENIDKYGDIDNKDEIEDIEKMAILQNDTLPYLNSINEELQNTFERLLSEFKDAKDEYGTLKIRAAKESANSDMLERQRESRISELSKAQEEGQFVIQCLANEQQEKTKFVQQYKKQVTEMAAVFREAPGLYESKTLTGELDTIRSSANTLSERLQRMEEEIQQMRELTVQHEGHAAATVKPLQDIIRDTLEQHGVNMETVAPFVWSRMTIIRAAAVELYKRIIDRFSRNEVAAEPPGGERKGADGQQGETGERHDQRAPHLQYSAGPLTFRSYLWVLVTSVLTLVALGVIFQVFLASPEDVS